MYVCRADLRREELIGIFCAVAVLILLLSAVLVVATVVSVRRRKRRRGAVTSRVPADETEGIDNWSIPRPRPRVWQTNTSMMSSERRRKRRRYHDDDLDDDDLELRQRPNGHALPPLHRNVNGGLLALGLANPLEVMTSPATARHGTESSPSSPGEVGPVGTPPRLRRYVKRQLITFL